LALSIYKPEAMAWLRWLAPVLLALAVASLAGGGRACRNDASPELIEVLDVTPREVELGDGLTLIGEGFPPGKAARVTFRGALHRPGERPESDTEIVVSGIVAGPDHVQLAFTEATLALFCGGGDRATHTTFDGEVEVAFAAAVPGAPPIVGALRHATLDVRPLPTASDGERDRDGARLLAWLGVRATPGPSGITVETVAAGSRAEASGIAVGDVLVSVDGLRVASLGDVLPAPGAREATVAVRRAGDHGEAVKTVSVEGFRRAPPVELFGATLVVLVAVAVVLLFGAPTPFFVAAALQRVVSRLRAARTGRVGTRGRATARSLAAVVGGAWREILPPTGPTALVDAVVSAMLAAMPFGQYLVAAQLDVGLLFVAAATALAATALVARGSVWRGVKAAVHVAWQHVPAAVAVATVVVTTGSLRVQEIERVQGGWPWDWLAFRSPVGLLALGLCLACARIEPDEPPLATVGARGPERERGSRTLEESGPERQRGPWLDAACRGHRLVLAGLASTLFLGGWRLPGLSTAAQDARPLFELLGAAGLLLKTWGLVALLALARAGLSQPTLRQRSGFAARWLAPLSAAALGASAVWAWWNLPSSVQTLMSGGLLAVAALAAVALAHRVHEGLVAPGADARVSPFL
jgi:NADH-quinone oxidoreductase subunit H